MFGRKYVFETKSTKMRRLLSSGVFLFLIFLGTALAFIAYIPIYAKMQKGLASGAFFQKSPDAIAVFTGDRGRISYALELIKKNPSAKLFISGVHAANSFQTLVDKQVSPDLSEEIKAADTQVDLDYESKNTFENVQETVHFLKQNSDLNKILIISSDYHIMRIKLIMSHFLKKAKPEIYFDSVPSSYRSWDDFRKLLKEAVKIIRTYLILKIAGDDVIITD